MQSAPPRDNEPSVLAALHALDVLCGGLQPELDALVRAASIACDTPISLISLVDAERQVFKANHGLPGVAGTSRDVAFCAHAVLDDELFEIPDSTLDPRFADNPLVTGAPHVRFYAGAPIVLADGARIGTICVVDDRPRTLQPAQREILRQLAIVAAKSLEAHRAVGAAREATTRSARALALIRHTGDAVIGLSVDECIVRWNPAAERLFGYREDEIIGRPLRVLTPPDARGRRNAVRAAIADGRSCNYHTEAQHRDGAPLSIHATFVPELDDAGRLSGASIFVRDVTAQDRAHSIVDSERAQLRTLLETIPDLVWLKDCSGIYLACNPAFESLFGASAADIVGKTDFDFMAPELARGLQAKDQAAVAAGRPIVNEEWATFAVGGRRALLETTKTPMHDGRGSLIGILGTARDITQHRRYRDHLEELVAERTAALVAANETKVRSSKLEAVGTLAAGIAHDFNNILASIVGFAELTGDELPEDSVAKRNIAQILKGSFRARDLVAHLLTFAGEQSPTPSEVDVASAIRETLALLRGSLSPKIDLALHDGLPRTGATILAAPAQVTQIVMNLCINAAHAMQDDGTIEIRVDLAPLDAAPAEPGAVPVQAVSLRITDHGTGMSAELQERIFDPFFTTKMPGEGSGLGLSVVYGIVANLGGRIAVSSSTTPGDSGTTFDVRIPVQHHRRT